MPSAGRAIPVISCLLAGGFLVAALSLPWLLPAVAGGAAVAACALALSGRRRPGLGRAMLAIGVWLGCGFGGAWTLRGEPSAGLAWILVALFALPLPVIPWLYARTFPDRDQGVQDGDS